jgi:hypothetical protein
MVMAAVGGWPPVTVVDIDESNDLSMAYIRVIAPPEKVDCGKVNEKATWSVVYSVLTGYRMRPYRECNTNSGVRVCHTKYKTDYNSPIYKCVNVSYDEKLTVSLAVSTGQGNLPDPAKPSPGDPDSRGAWEIIPYARVKGLNPDQVTRAGAGFTIQAETDYTTDWEKKVPSGAKARGYTANGPTKVTAEFYDTRGKLVKTIGMERTEGGAGAGKALWKLPEIKHKYLDGSQASKRWYYTEPDIPDGDYRVVVKVEGAGFNSLNTCKTAYVRIFGSIYDDVYTKITK